jgi:hypothetical protein
MKLPSAFLLQVSMANPQEHEAIGPFSHKVHMVLGPEIVEVVNSAEIMRNRDFLRCVSSGAKSPRNF